MRILLHEKIYQNIKEKINKGEWSEGDMLPTEIELEDLYKVSKAPIRQALRRLQEEGIIVRKAGKGTFVSGRREWPFLELNGLRESLNKEGSRSFCRTVHISLFKREDIELMKKENIDVSDGVVCKRIRYLDGVPIHYMEHSIFGLKEDVIRAAGNFSSLLQLYKENGIDIISAEDEIAAVLGNKHIERYLNLKSNEPLLKIKRKTYSNENKMIEFLYFYLKTDKWKYRVNYHV